MTPAVTVICQRSLSLERRSYLESGGQWMSAAPLLVLRPAARMAGPSEVRWLMSFHWLVVTLLSGTLAVHGCADFRSNEPDAIGTDGGRSSDATPPVEAGEDGGGSGEGGVRDSGMKDANAPPDDGATGPACHSVVLDCLDPTSPDVLEVPSEMAAAQAFAQAAATQTIQIRGLVLGAGWKVPPYVTLHGCSGAKIAGDTAFVGSGGVIEGFEVNATLVANQTGSFVVRSNRFTGTAPQAVSARSIDALVSASVTLLVDGNLFTNSAIGVVADTNYDTLTHEITLTVQNNVFHGVARPVVVTEGGLAGKITAKIQFNTFHTFDTAISLLSVTPRTPTLGNLFVSGTSAIDSDSPAYTLDDSMGFQVTTATPQKPPLSGTLGTGDPLFVAPAQDDFRLGATSPAIDVVPTGTDVPSSDYTGCTRPRAFRGTEAKADLGANEAQP
jgi:hypothetical protein